MIGPVLIALAQQILEVVRVILDQVRAAGPRALGWDRLFVPAGFESTLAELVADPDATDADELRAAPYRALAAALAAT